LGCIDVYAEFYLIVGDFVTKFADLSITLKKSCRIKQAVQHPFYDFSPRNESRKKEAAVRQPLLRNRYIRLDNPLRDHRVRLQK